MERVFLVDLDLFPIQTRDLEEELNKRAIDGWEFVAFTPDGRPIYRNARWESRSQDFKPFGMKSL